MGSIKRHARTVAIVVALGITSIVALRNRRAVLSSALAALGAGWMLVPALALFVAWNHVATLAWRRLAVATATEEVTPPLWRLALLRFQGQALNLLVPAAGEVARAAGMADHRGRASIVLDLVSCAIAEAAFAASALLLHPTLRPGRLPAAALVAVIVAAAWWLPVLVQVFVRALGSRLTSRLGGLTWFRGDVQGAFRRAVGWHALECVLSAGEVWLFSSAMGLALPFTSIYVAAAAVRTGTTIIAFVPGQIGVAEGSLVWAMTSLGHPASAGLALAFARRGRQVVVIALGALSLLAMSFNRSKPKGVLAHENSLHPAS
jgi:hypothetical protein